jgi:anti-sigma regulatory factor (Ser/Thr protein kinase)
VLDEPEAFLRRTDPAHPATWDLDQVRLAEPWALVGLATLARNGGAARVPVERRGGSDAARFAHAIGFDDVVAGRPSETPGEPGRTVRMIRFSGFAGLEAAARRIGTLVLPQESDEDSRLVVQYVVIELLRNVVQHSHDPLGGVVVAQRMDRLRGTATPCVQVAVGDAGIGILESMRPAHPELGDPRAALEKAIRPHISGSFAEGLTGSSTNAGMGLFFISEMARLSVGRLLLATRGATLVMRGNMRNVERPTVGFLRPRGIGYPGTLVAFELPLGKVLDYEGLIRSINERARERTPERTLHHWLRFVPPPPGTARFEVASIAEDAAQAQLFADRKLVPRIVRRQPVALDFRGLEICTQSFLHALLFRTVRLAWAERSAIYALNADPAVRSGIETVEAYALGG